MKSIKHLKDLISKNFSTNDKVKFHYFNVSEFREFGEDGVILDILKCPGTRWLILSKSDDGQSVGEILDLLSEGDPNVPAFYITQSNMSRLVKVRKHYLTFGTDATNKGLPEVKFDNPQRLSEGIKPGELSLIPEATFNGCVPRKSIIPSFLYEKHSK